MTTIEYTKRTSGFEKGVQYRNPKHFVKPERCDAVVLDGEMPTIQSAYEAAGVAVSVKGNADAPEAVSTPDDASESDVDTEESERDQLIAEYEERFGKSPRSDIKTDTLRSKLEAVDEDE